MGESQRRRSWRCIARVKYLPPSWPTMATRRPMACLYLGLRSSSERNVYDEESVQRWCTWYHTVCPWGKCSNRTPRKRRPPHEYGFGLSPSQVPIVLGYETAEREKYAALTHPAIVLQHPCGGPVRSEVLSIRERVLGSRTSRRHVELNPAQCYCNASACCVWFPWRPWHSDTIGAASSAVLTRQNAHYSYPPRYIVEERFPSSRYLPQADWVVNYT